VPTAAKLCSVAVTCSTCRPDRLACIDCTRRLSRKRKSQRLSSSGSLRHQPNTNRNSLSLRKKSAKREKRAPTRPGKDTTIRSSTIPFGWWLRADRCLLPRDRESTRLNSSHVRITHAGFCLKKNRGARSDHVLCPPGD